MLIYRVRRHCNNVDMRIISQSLPYDYDIPYPIQKNQIIK
jgi:hypothetical protein